eukprot:12907359-Prorocentrum_lima.AAC.1
MDHGVPEGVIIPSTQQQGILCARDGALWLGQHARINADASNQEPLAYITADRQEHWFELTGHSGEPVHRAICNLCPAWRLR